MMYISIRLWFSVRYPVIMTWFAGSESKTGSTSLVLAGSGSLISPDESPLVWPGEFFSIKGILSNTAALRTITLIAQ